MRKQRKYSNCGQEVKKQVGGKVRNRGKCSNCGQEVKEQVGGKVVKQRKMLQLRTGRERAGWGKYGKTEENTPIADRK